MADVLVVRAPLMFQPVPVDRALAGMFGAAVGRVLAVHGDGGVLDQHGVGVYLVGLVELVLRSALRSHLHRADTAAVRCRRRSSTSTGTWPTRT